jgi:flavin reductase (DIM6/NTAB) family NADH-FMN oxidoreductase RutF/rubredoxin
MDSQALTKISSGLYVTGVKNGGSFGGSLVDALIQATNANPPHIIFCSMNGNNTTELIKKSGEFTVSVLGDDVNPFVLANFGFQSSRNVDKWANVEHELRDGLPVLKNAAAAFLCKVEDIRIMSTHNIFTCTVENAWLGSGEPLLYGDYHKNLKTAVAAAFTEFKTTGKLPADTVPLKTEATNESKKEQWVCTVCGYIYDEAVPVEELPDEWTCPLCGAAKSLFEKQWL